MRRLAWFAVWHSRSRLALLSATMLLMVVTMEVIRSDVEDLLLLAVDDGLFGLRTPNKSSLLSATFTDDVADALDAIQYMFNLTNGRAEIRDVIEKESKVREYWRCRQRRPSQVHDVGWILNDGLHVFSATLDRRPNSLFPSNSAIQVLAMSFRSIPPKRRYFCHLLDLRSGQSAVVEAAIREIWQRAWDPRDYFYIPNLITCPVPRWLDTVGDSELVVSLSTVPCATNLDSGLRIRDRAKHQKLKKEKVAVCVKGMDFLSDISTRLVEWIEAQLMFGADTITIYVYYVPPKTQQVLEYYQEKGLLTVISMSLPGDSPNQSFIRSRFIWRNRQQKRRHELIPYNDCLYRHIDTHEYVLIVDTDEIVVPLKCDNWTCMLDEIIVGKSPNVGSRPESVRQKVTSISVRNVFKFPSKSPDPEAAPFMYMLQNRRRSQTISKSGDYGKSFTSTLTAASVFNHFALHRLHGDVWRTINADPTVALKLHYKEKCPIESRHDCSMLEKVTVDDPSLDRFAGRLTERVREVLTALNMI